MEPNRLKHVVYGTLALVVLNFALLATLLFARPSAPCLPREALRGPFRQEERLQRSLSFSDSQQDAFHDLRDRHQREMDSLRSLIFLARQRLYAGMGAHRGSPDSLFEAIGALNARMEREIFRHFDEVRTLCTPEQAERFDTLVPRLMRHAAPSRRFPSPGEPGGFPDGRP